MRIIHQVFPVEIVFIALDEIRLREPRTNIQIVLAREDRALGHTLPIDLRAKNADNLRTVFRDREPRIRVIVGQFNRQIRDGIPAHLDIADDTERLTRIPFAIAIRISKRHEGIVPFLQETSRSRLNVRQSEMHLLACSSVNNTTLPGDPHKSASQVKMVNLFTFTNLVIIILESRQIKLDIASTIVDIAISECRTIESIRMFCWIIPTIRHHSIIYLSGEPLGRINVMVDNRARRGDRVVLRIKEIQRNTLLRNHTRSSIKPDHAIRILSKETRTAN